MTLDALGSDLQLFRAALLRFYREKRRDLPWRRDPHPYGVLVSEVMLQQTRVDTVVPYYERWMERFPTPASLAEADTEEVLRLWQGLGYYRRARNLQRAVREIGVRYEGRIPEDPAELESLPGVGPYTAGAVASIAFGTPAPAVDGNVRRVLARLMDDPAPSPARLRERAARLVDPERPGEFNQALMELGATVCTPRSPECGVCPIAEYCRARERGTQEDRPEPRRRGSTPLALEAVTALVDRRGADWRVLLRRRPEEGLLGGMWELPGARFEPGDRPEAVAERLAAELHRSAGGAGEAPVLDRTLDPVEHVFSHLRVLYHPHVFAAAAPTPPGLEAGEGGARREEERAAAGRELRWVESGELGELPLPAAQTRILSYLG